MPNYSQIFRSMVCSDAGMVFIEGYIQTIMETILNAPVLSPCMRKVLHTFQRGNRIAYLGGLVFTHGYMRMHHAKAWQSWPVCGILQSGQVCGQTIHPFFDSSVSLVDGFVWGHFRIPLRMLQRILETGFRVFMEQLMWRSQVRDGGWIR